MSKNNKTLIGRRYRPYDNSYCINCSNNKGTCIVQRNELFDGTYYPNKDEDGASFIIVSKPYEEIVHFFGDRTYTFIKVKSSLTGNVYRTLYNKRMVF